MTTRTASRPATHKDAAAASGVIQKNAASRAGTLVASDAADASATVEANRVRRTVRKPRPTAKTGDPVADKAIREAATPEAKPGSAHAAEVENAVLAGVGADKPVAPVGAKRPHQFVLMSSGQFEVHKMGCRDVGRTVRSKESQYDKALSAEWASEEEAIRDLYADQIHEDVIDYTDPALLAGSLYAATVDFQPCCDLIPFTGKPATTPAPKATPKPRTVANGKGATTANRTRTTAPKTTPAAKAPKQVATSKATQGTGAKAESEAQAARRTAKRNLARRVLLSIEGMLNDLTPAELTALGMTRDDARKTASQWVHHLPVRDTTEVSPWWPATMPKPDRSDWR